MNPRDFEDIVNRHYADLYRFALSLTRNPDTAADMVQETFTIFARKGDSIREVEKRKSWLFTTLYRECIHQGAGAARIVSMEGEALEAHLAPVPDGAARSAEHHELLAALASLDEPHRAVLALFYLEDCSYKEIAEILDLPTGTVMSRLSRAKEALRTRLERGINPPPSSSDQQTHHG